MGKMGKIFTKMEGKTKFPGGSNKRERERTHSSNNEKQFSENLMKTRTLISLPFRMILADRWTGRLM